MKRIYLTEQAKQEIENRIEEIEKHPDFNSMWNHDKDRDILKVQWNIYKNILSSATILPVEENCDKWWKTSADSWFDELKEKYPQGIIIQSKQ